MILTALLIFFLLSGYFSAAGYLPVLVMVFSSIAIPLCILEVHILHILHLVTAIILKIIISTALI